MSDYEFIDHSHDVVVIGAGGAGLRATFGLAESSFSTACITKVFPTRSHTVAAQGGISAALGNMGEDDWRWHMYDTVKGSDWLGDQDAIEYMCKEAADAVIELEHYGVPFSRTEDGRIYQRPFGGMTTRFGEGTAQRTCAAADRTGHAMLHTLYQQSLKHDAEFCIEYFAVDLIMEDGTCRGVVAIDLATGRLHRFRSHQVILATGGYGRAYFSCTSAHTCTGDGSAMVLRAGLPVQDMEFVQFHPTGLLAGHDTRMTGTVLEEGLRGAGGYLLDGDGRRFMFDYDALGERATRDIVSRGIYDEMRRGRTTPNGGVYIQMSHLGPDDVRARFAGMVKRCADCGFDLAGGRVEVVPTAHYFMGGVVCDTDTRTTLPGLYVAGEDAGGAVDDDPLFAPGALLALAPRGGVGLIGGHVRGLPPARRGPVSACLAARPSGGNAGYADVLGGVGEQGHVASALDRLRQEPLALGGAAAAPARLHLAALRQVAAQHRRVLVVDDARPGRAELARPAPSAAATETTTAPAAAATAATIPEVVS